jgi:hypothetical protein
MQNRPWNLAITWSEIAGVGVGRRNIEIAKSNKGTYRVLYSGFGRDHQKFDIEPNETSLLARVDKEMGKLAGEMIREGLRISAARSERSERAAAPEVPGSTGACPL